MNLRLLAVTAIAGTIVGLYPFDYFTEPIADTVRWINAATGLIAFVGLLWRTTPHWSAYSPGWRDAILTLLIYEFVAAAGAGRALALDLPPNELSVAILFANIGAIRLLWHDHHRALTAPPRP
jgi:hypothetical protein